MKTDPNPATMDTEPQQFKQDKVKPKPATGEWTEERVRSFCNTPLWPLHLADAINADIDAEMEKLAGKEEFWSACEVGYEAEIKQLSAQLAAAQAAIRSGSMSETVKWTPQTVNDLVRHDGYKGVADAHNRLELELAKAQAAIARHNFQMDVDRDINCTEIKIDTTALAAAIDEATKPLATANLRLVDALKSLRDGTWHPKDDKHHSLKDFINTALAKVVQP